MSSGCPRLLSAIIIATASTSGAASRRGCPNGARSMFRTVSMIRAHRVGASSGRTPSASVNEGRARSERSGREGDHLLRKKKLKMEFSGCSDADTRRAFFRACIAKSVYHKPSLSRRMGAALPLRPRGCARRRLSTRRGPRRPSGHRGVRPRRGSGLRAVYRGKGAQPPLFSECSDE